MYRWDSFQGFGFLFFFPPENQLLQRSSIKQTPNNHMDFHRTFWHVYLQLLIKALIIHSSICLFALYILLGEIAVDGLQHSLSMIKSAVSKILQRTEQREATVMLREDWNRPVQPVDATHFWLLASYSNICWNRCIWPGIISELSMDKN